LQPAHAQAVERKLAQAREERVAERVRAGDATLWGPPGTPEIADRLAWLSIAQRMQTQSGELRAFAEEVRGEGVRDVVLLGMGGSSLAAETMRLSFGPRAGWPTLHVLDSTDAAAVLAVQRAIDPHNALFLVSSKSGGTVEPLSMFAHFWTLAPDGRRFVAITDPDSGLEQLAHAHGFRRVFAGDPGIGGRYSALSNFGMVPAALAGWEVEGLLQGGEAALRAAGMGRVVAGERAADADAQSAGDAQDNAQCPAWLWLGAALSAWAQGGRDRDKLTIIAQEPLSSFGLWLEQLVAESTGKRETGILPVAQEPLGEPAVYGEDRVFLHIPDRTSPDAQIAARMSALAQAGRPVLTLPADGASDLGRIFMLCELAVAVAGWGLGINPFDQPNVQQAKDATKRVLAGFERSGTLPEARDANVQALYELLSAPPPSYVAIMGYVQPSAGFDAAVAELRSVVRDATRATTTFGYGPRFLHSTGQFHKGGPKTGRFLQLIHDGAEDAEIPGSVYSFTTLKNAQALGDLETLRALELPAERVRLPGDDPAAALLELTKQMKEAL
jgi:glucose-6-phosphate isomerase